MLERKNSDTNVIVTWVKSVILFSKIGKRVQLRDRECMRMMRMYDVGDIGSDIHKPGARPNCTPWSKWPDHLGGVDCATMDLNVLSMSLVLAPPDFNINLRMLLHC